MKTFIGFIFTALLTSGFSAAAENATAYEVVSQVGEQLFSRIKAEQSELKLHPEMLENIVEQELMPYIDHRYAAFKILGKSLPKITKEQRDKFVEAVRVYLVKTYTSALRQYKSQQVIFHRPLNEEANILAINSVIKEANRPDINVDFKMRFDKTSQQWKAFDLVVEGISLLSAKQAEIGRRISNQGIDETTASLIALAE